MYRQELALCVEIEKLTIHLFLVDAIFIVIRGD
jgi:hypothetical protein